MHIAVCVKQVPNPDALAAVLRIDPEGGNPVLPPGHPLVVSPFDEQAMEAALRLRDAAGETGTRITAITLGPDSARAALKHCLALGADDAVHLLDPGFSGSDAAGVARALAATIRSLETVDLVLTGRQAADLDAGVVGLGIAETLGWTAVSFACGIATAPAGIRVDRVIPDGIEAVEAGLPALVTISNELGEPRKASLRETMKAARKPVVVRSPADLGLTAADVGPDAVAVRRRRLFIPEKTGVCERIEGSDATELAARLLDRLLETRALELRT